MWPGDKGAGKEGRRRRLFKGTNLSPVLTRDSQCRHILGEKSEGRRLKSWPAGRRLLSFHCDTFLLMLQAPQKAEIIKGYREGFSIITEETCTHNKDGPERRGSWRWTEQQGVD